MTIFNLLTCNSIVSLCLEFTRVVRGGVSVRCVCRKLKVVVFAGLFAFLTSHTVTFVLLRTDPPRPHLSLLFSSARKTLPGAQAKAKVLQLRHRVLLTLLLLLLLLLLLFVGVNAFSALHHHIRTV